MRRYPWLTLFAVAMAFLEAAVVVYLRQLYYPGGFQFPMVMIPARNAFVELAREAATVVMLLVVGRLGAETAWQRFAGFMYVFGIWDLFYYVWLKVTLGWPASLFTWDVLFLIPVPWVGPVLAPVLVSISLIAAALAVERALATGRWRAPSPWEWGGFIVAGLVVILSFTLDWRAMAAGAVPARFHWGVFWLGEGLALVLFARGFIAARRRAEARPPAR